jgi:hypothetical protein
VVFLNIFYFILFFPGVKFLYFGTWLLLVLLQRKIQTLGNVKYFAYLIRRPFLIMSPLFSVSSSFVFFFQVSFLGKGLNVFLHVPGPLPNSTCSIGEGLPNGP